MLIEKVLSDIRFLFPAKPDMDSFISQRATVPFADIAVEFLHALSQELSRNSGKYPELTSLAFFCRKGNIGLLKNKYVQPSTSRLGRGIVFHITPSNVPLNFAYSLVSGILSGNINIVRVPSRDFEQVRIVCRAIETLHQDEQYRQVTNKIMLVSYDRQTDATAYFSSICDVRVIWGGDTTIEQIRRNSMPSRAFDISFADRYSVCVINADKYVTEIDHRKIAIGFYNDTYLFDQNACTSPHLIIWLGTGEHVEKAKNIFWEELHKIVKEKYPAIPPILAVDKLTSFYAQAAEAAQISSIKTDDNTIWRIELKELPADIDRYKCAGGYFSEYHASSLSELGTIIDRKYQTLAYYGISENVWKDFVINGALSGIDRVVPIGRTSDFSLTWDGFDLITSLSRNVEIISG
jgi:hypothetical protein